MSKTTAELFREALALGEADRAELAGVLIESLEAERDPDVEAAWLSEIERRIKDLDSGAVEAIPWEEVRERLLRRVNATETG